MILSIFATVAVLAAIAAIAAALVFAETVLVYIALGLGGVSALLLLGAVIQGRFRAGSPDRERSGTDGLGKSSVPTMVPGPRWEPEYSGRVPASAFEPVREAAVQERSSWAAPVAEDFAHGEPEFEVPRWQTPTAGDWPEPVTQAPGPAPVEGAPRTADASFSTVPAPPIEEPVPEPLLPEPEEPGDNATPIADGTAAEVADKAQSAFSYSISSRSSSDDAVVEEDGFSSGAQPFDEASADHHADSEEPEPQGADTGFRYSVPGRDASEPRANDDAHGTAAPETYGPYADVAVTDVVPEADESAEDLDTTGFSHADESDDVDVAEMDDSADAEAGAAGVDVVPDAGESGEDFDTAAGFSRADESAEADAAGVDVVPDAGESGEDFDTTAAFSHADESEKDSAVAYAAVLEGDTDTDGTVDANR